MGITATLGTVTVTILAAFDAPQEAQVVVTVIIAIIVSVALELEHESNVSVLVIVYVVNDPSVHLSTYVAGRDLARLEFEKGGGVRAYY